MLKNLFVGTLFNICDGDVVDESEEDAEPDSGENRPAEVPGLAEKQNFNQHNQSYPDERLNNNPPPERQITPEIE
jgi:hypothetical protein